jgi:viroplasmin and RNaseH domain-containing protein
MAKNKAKYYAVKAGFTTGIYKSWSECEKQVKGFLNPKFKKFESRNEAMQFLLSTNQPNQTKSSKSYKPKKFSRRNNQKTTDTIKISKKSPDSTILSIWFDGGCRGNGKNKVHTVSGSGFIVTISSSGSSNNNIDAPSPPVTLVWRYDFLPNVVTNNEAEYEGLINGLEECLSLLPSVIKRNPKVYVDIMGDSDLILKQVQGTWRCHAENLRPFLARAKNLVNQISKLCPSKPGLRHVPRNMNKEADMLANLAMDKRKSVTERQLTVERYFEGSTSTEGEGGSKKKSEGENTTQATSETMVGNKTVAAEVEELEPESDGPSTTSENQDNLQDVLASPPNKKHGADDDKMSTLEKKARHNANQEELRELDDDSGSHLNP